MARRSKLTPERQEALLELLRAGTPAVYALPQVNLSESTYYRWLQEGEAAAEALREAEAGQGRYREPPTLRAKREFRESVKSAESEAVAIRVARIARAGRGGAQTTETKLVTRPDGSIEETVTVREAGPTWTADAWWLERRLPHLFGRRDAVEVSSNDEATVLGRLVITDPEVRAAAVALRTAIALRPVDERRDEDTG